MATLNKVSEKADLVGGKYNNSKKSSSKSKKKKDRRNEKNRFTTIFLKFRMLSCDSSVCVCVCAWERGGGKLMQIRARG